MIKTIKGDLIKQANQFDVIAHGANCFLTFGAGIALQIKKAFPEANDIDQATPKGDKKKLGTITHTFNTTPIVVNAYTQYGFGGKRYGKMDASYDAIQSCMEAVKKTFSGKRIGLPKIGSDLAGGDWTVISAIIESVLGDEDVTIIEWDGDITNTIQTTTPDPKNDQNDFDDILNKV